MTTNPPPLTPPVSTDAAPRLPAAAPRPPVTAPRSAASADSPKRPLRVLLTVLELAALGVFGTAVFVVLTTLLGVGLGLVFVFGIGLIFLVGLVYALFGVAWVEVRRVSDLYGDDMLDLRWRPRTQPGFGGW